MRANPFRYLCNQTAAAHPAAEQRSITIKRNQIYPSRENEEPTISRNFAENRIQLLPTPHLPSPDHRVPFCIFKLLSGVLSIRNHHDAIIFLGLFRLADHCLGVRRPSHELDKSILSPFRPRVVCGVLHHRSGRTHLWKAQALSGVDTFRSFSIICFVLWSGWI
jgi:hypothetical protein